MTDLNDTCTICGKRGKVCVDLVITGDRQVVHMGQCHDQLVRREEESRVGRMIDEIQAEAQ